MSLLQNDNHQSDAEQSAIEASEKFSHNALLVINDNSPGSSINSNEVLSALIVSQAIVYLGQCYITPLIAELENISNGLNDLIESIDCAGANPIEHWKQSDIAAIDKAKELGINIPAEYSYADLRYKIDCAIHEVI